MIGTPDEIEYARSPKVVDNFAGRFFFSASRNAIIALGLIGKYLLRLNIFIIFYISYHALVFITKLNMIVYTYLYDK